MKVKSALAMYGLGITFAIIGSYYRPILIAGWVTFGILAILGLIFEWQ